MKANRQAILVACERQILTHALDLIDYRIDHDIPVDLQRFYDWSSTLRSDPGFLRMVDHQTAKAERE